MIYLQLEPPAQWPAGKSGDQPIFFDCADCGEHEAHIAGVIADVSPDAAAPLGLTAQQVAVLTDPPKGPRLAMFCRACFEKRKTTP